MPFARRWTICCATVNDGFVKVFSTLAYWLSSMGKKRPAQCACRVDRGRAGAITAYVIGNFLVVKAFSVCFYVSSGAICLHVISPSLEDEPTADIRRFDSLAMRTWFAPPLRNPPCHSPQAGRSEPCARPATAESSASTSSPCTSCASGRAHASRGRRDNRRPRYARPPRDRRG